MILPRQRVVINGTGGPPVRSNAWTVPFLKASAAAILVIERRFTGDRKVFKDFSNIWVVYLFPLSEGPVAGNNSLKILNCARFELVSLYQKMYSVRPEIRDAPEFRKRLVFINSRPPKRH